MAINFNEGDKVIVNQAFVSNTLAQRNPTPDRKSLLSHLSRLEGKDLLVSRALGRVNAIDLAALIKVTVIGSVHIESPILTFESEDDLNNAFTLVKAFNPNRTTIIAINGDDEPIKPGYFVTLKNYQGSNPQVPVVIAPRQDNVDILPIFGLTLTHLGKGESGTILTEGFFPGLGSTSSSIQDSCHVELVGEDVMMVPGSIYRTTSVTVDPGKSSLIYFPKQPGGAYNCFERRSFSGIGNNKTLSSRGEVNSQLKRWGKASYPDKKSMMPRRPNARTISNNIVAQSISRPNENNVTDYLWAWGQFLDHDIGLIEAASPQEPANIEIPAGDPVFPASSLTFNRSDYDSSTGTTNIRQHINTQSSYIDASNIYGTDVARAEALRANDGTGQMDTGPGNLLPKNTRLYPNIPNSHDALYYFAGDVRANEQLLLLAMHTLWIREHNRIADEIRAVNSHLTGDQIYQAARRKVIALNQAITFNEFLPILLGTNAIPDYTGYQPAVDSSISNEFSSGLYRVGHSMVSEKIQRLDASLNTISEGWTFLRDAYFRPDRLTEGGGIEPLLRGAAKQVCQKIDTHVVDGLRNFLFGSPGAGGLDLAALSIQRGRDHGLPTYNNMRVILGLPAIRSYAEITSDVSLRNNLIATYSNINEIDLWIGMLAEDHVGGALVGPTLRAGLIRQFLALRDGDRFWYESVFSGDLLAEINSTKLSDVIKRNTDIGAELQTDVFYL
jgi:peroxidase